MRATPAIVALCLVGCAHAPPGEPAAPPPSAPAHQSLAAAAVQGLLLPPAEPGALRFSAAGCAATPEQPPPDTRALPPEDQVQASGVQGGVVLTHEVSHACCLSAASTVAISGQKVTITETFSGTACRCRCGSSLRTAVGLLPGAWSVELKTQEAGQTRTAWTGPLVVK